MVSETINRMKRKVYMNPSSFEYIPDCDRDSFLGRDPLSDIEMSEPPPVTTRLTIDEIVQTSNVNDITTTREEGSGVEEGTDRPKRL